MVVVLTHLGLMLGNEFEEKKVFYEEDEIFGGREMFNFFFFWYDEKGKGRRHECISQWRFWEGYFTDNYHYHDGVDGKFFDTLDKDHQLVLTTTNFVCLLFNILLNIYIQYSILHNSHLPIS